jgi:transcriptional regulator with XRE-family HTH domain
VHNQLTFRLRHDVAPVGDYVAGMEDHIRIRVERQRRGMSQKELGAAVGITQAAIEKIESGKTAKSRYVSDLLRYLGLKEGVREVPVVGYVSAGDTSVHYTDQGVMDTISGPDDTSEVTVAVLIRGESLGPAFDGWYAFYDDVRHPPSPDLMGELCVVGLPDERVLIKQIRAASVPGLYHLISQAGDAPMTDVRVAWAARVKHLSRGLGF